MRVLIMKNQSFPIIHSPITINPQPSLLHSLNLTNSSPSLSSNPQPSLLHSLNLTNSAPSLSSNPPPSFLHFLNLKQLFSTPLLQSSTIVPPLPQPNQLCSIPLLQSSTLPT
ncbi:hypothetical protein Pcinc_027955 [Petrolisthes cinctipes]|uniref:Uncharacterized protein n=1 Tax=Petrolisthes cinctipes TaxID=88211 RepID=A0AAE1F3Z8_PETCI|nr:hypothetical protein Pcinc_027955 [Petrolisthes cinctipes]